ncbi:MAG: hypothetical protein EWM72_01464 [Nitrospira sp.]|nr:MAG: hypothetical protein EWM72_01464 [Nitrospira sp.]
MFRREEKLSKVVMALVVGFLFSFVLYTWGSLVLVTVWSQTVATSLLVLCLVVWSITSVLVHSGGRRVALFPMPDGSGIQKTLKSHRASPPRS